MGGEWGVSGGGGGGEASAIRRSDRLRFSCGSAAVQRRFSARYDPIRQIGS